MCLSSMKVNRVGELQWAQSQPQRRAYLHFRASSPFNQTANNVWERPFDNPDRKLTARPRLRTY